MPRDEVSLPTDAGTAPALPGVSGPFALDRRTKNLTKRLRPGDIAVIDHVDLDRVSAEALVACGVAAVVNVSPSISGRYPNLGPEILVAAGIPLVDDVGPRGASSRLREGDTVRLDAETLYRGDDVVAQGRRADAGDRGEPAMDEARAGLSAQLEAFAANTMEYLRQERDLLLDGVGVPDISTDLEGRQVLIVVRGYHYKEDLVTLRPYIREYRPVLIGVDGGADALLEAGYRPDLIVGDMDSVSDAALSCGAEIVVHAYRDGTAPGLERVQALGLEPGGLPGDRHERGRRDAARRRQGREPDRRGRHPRDARGVPRQGPGRHGEHVPHPAAGRRQARRRQGREPALPQPHRDVAGPVPSRRQGCLRSRVALAATPLGRSFYDIVGSRWHDFTFWLRGIF